MKYRIYIMMILSGLLVVMQSCKEDALPAEDVAVEVHTRVSPSGDKATAALLFWDSNTFHNNWLQGEGNAVPVFGPVTLDNDIDYYRYGVRTFTVGMEYPKDDNEYIYATGYAPYNALDISEDYKTLTVKDGYKEGKTDFLCCDGKEDHKGSASDLFTEQKHELKFRHLTPRIRFVGKRDPVMYGVISVNNVKVTLHADNNLYIPQEFVFKSNTDKTAQTYQAVLENESLNEQLVFTQETQDYIPANEEGLSLMSCYFFCGKLPDSYNPFVDPETNEGEKKTVSLKMDISADYSWYVPDGDPVIFDTPKWVGENVDIELKHTGECFYPGYEYVVYLTFKRESVVLQGVQQNWEDGGIHYLPVTPPDNQ